MKGVKSGIVPSTIVLKENPKVYRGIKSSHNTDGNLMQGNQDTIWFECVDGNYRCYGKELVVTPEQIENDYQNKNLEQILDN